ncbi:MAG: tetratricopeptide repeat protein [Polyangiaceae bacterium]|nr:tetratricopeptide repeat protein [Polyangiaceae bacterium]
MSISLPPPNTTPPDPGPLADSIGRLRSEFGETTVPEAQATLLYEIALLEEQAEDDSSAARDLLGAVSAVEKFREPLEHLVSILRRRESAKNLGKLLERLSASAEGTEESTHALVEYAAFLIQNKGDFDEAKVQLRRALELNKEESSAGLLLELAARRSEDPEAAAEAIEGRLHNTIDASWAALLRLDLAELAMSAGEGDKALRLTVEVVESKSTASFAALLSLEKFARELDNNETLARALEGQASLLTKSLDDEDGATARGIPRYKRKSPYIADAWLRASEAHRRQGDSTAACALLDRALRVLPDESLLLHARLQLAEALNDTESAAARAQAELEHGVKGSPAASLWMRTAEACASQGDASGAVNALSSALKEDPGCVPARSLLLDLLAGNLHGADYPTALEETAEQFSDDETKGKFFLLSAEAWIRYAGDVQGAQAALAQAGLSGANKPTLARVGRMLASLAKDTAWYEESTRRLITTTESDTEKLSLSFELALSSLLQGNLDACSHAVKNAGAHPDGAWLAAAMSSYVIPAMRAAAATSPETAPPEASTAATGTETAEDSAPTPLLELAAVESDPERARCFRLAAALRQLAMKDRAGAIAQLTELQQADPSEAVVAALLSVLMRTDDPTAAAAILRSCADSLPEDDLRTALQLEAGMLQWSAGERTLAIETFRTAGTGSEELVQWALRASAPDDLPSRRQTLVSTSMGGPMPELSVLESWGLSVHERNEALGTEALKDLSAADSRGFRDAAKLASACFADASDDEAGHWLNFHELGSEARALEASRRYYAALADTASDPKSVPRWAAAWAAESGDLPSALEILGIAVARKDQSAEIAARLSLARHISDIGDDTAVDAFKASASLLQHLKRGASPPELLRGRSPAAVLTNLELAEPGGDAERRARAFSNVGGSLGDSTSGMAAALAGFNWLKANNASAAVEEFRRALETHPDELFVWQGLKDAATALGDPEMLAEACAALGDITADPLRGAALWEEASHILLDQLGDEERGEQALERAVSKDIDRFSCFDRWFRILRARKDNPALLELIERRLEVADDPKQIAKLYWERARAYRQLNDTEQALAALDNVTLLEPDHVGALALTGEIHITAGRFEEAAEKLARLSVLEDAPDKQRLMSGVAAVDLYENKLKDLDRAVEVLSALHASGLSTMPVRERLARVAAKAAAWETAITALSELMQKREDSAGRAQAARLTIAIYRDKLAEPERAEVAVTRLLAEIPHDGEALDLLLSNIFPSEFSTPLLTSGSRALVRKLGAEPMDAENVGRLTAISEHLEDLQLLQASLGVSLCLSQSNADVEAELLALDRRVASTPQIKLDKAAINNLCDPEDGGAIAELFQLLAPTITKSIGPSLDRLGVGRRDRLKANSGLAIRNEIIAWAGALGVENLEIYVGGADDETVTAVASDKPILVIGTAVSAPLQPQFRQRVARELLALRRGTSLLRHRESPDVAAMVAAACRLSGSPLESPDYALLGEFEHQLSKHAPRKVKKQIVDVCKRIQAEGVTTEDWADSARSSLDRMATIAAGDVSWVLAFDGERGRLEDSHEMNARAKRLLSFVLSPEYLSIREKLGMGIR